MRSRMLQHGAHCPEVQLVESLRCCCDQIEEHGTVVAKRLGEAPITCNVDDFVFLPRGGLRKRINRILSCVKSLVVASSRAAAASKKLSAAHIPRNSSKSTEKPPRTTPLAKLFLGAVA